MARSAEPSRVAKTEDAAEVAALLDGFQAEFDEPTPGADVLEPRVREHVEGDLSVFLLAGPPDTGVAQLRFRLELMQTAMRVARERDATTMELGTSVSDRAARELYGGLGFTNLEKAGDPTSQMLYYEREL